MAALALTQAAWRLRVPALRVRACLVVEDQVWDRYGVERTGVVAHDYGVSVAQELLAAHGERLHVSRS